MSRRLAFAALVALALPHVCVSVARASSARGPWVAVSSYDDDPFVADAGVERLGRASFGSDRDGRLVLGNGTIEIEDEEVVYREDPATGEYIAFAWNPWSADLTRSNEAGDFYFPDEPRFPLHRVERDAEGRPVLVDGLQLWLPQDLHRGMTTTFEAVAAAKRALELWAGRELAWGDGGRLDINAHAFIDFNAFFSPTAQSLFLGVVPHRLPGEPRTAPVKMFETATSWELAAHEAGHALHAVLKPNIDKTDPGYRTWGESFGDQTAMWTSLLDSGRVRRLLAETGGDLNRSSSLTGMIEAFGELLGDGLPMRDAFHDKRISDTSPEVHDRSEVLTGAAYRLFLAVYGGTRSEDGAAQALTRAGRVLGTFLARAADFMPETQLTLEDVAKAYLEVDAEIYDGRYHDVLVAEFTRRELFDAGSVDEWRAHRAALPELRLPRAASDAELGAWLRANLDALGVGPQFGLRLQSATRLDRVRPDAGSGHAIVRVQLTLGREKGATPLDNYGILVFRANGELADYHAPLPASEPTATGRAASMQVQAEALGTLADARAIGLDRRGAPVAIVRGKDGRLEPEARVLSGDALDPHMVVFTREHPDGERREIVVPPV
ncbi:MAG TPA: hypothetical protein VHQ66_09800, partial [Myxococcota bacterium]|nr:hypothetical protein [Myxococcota bacterium]